LLEQEDYDQFPGWVGGLFAANGSFYITRSGETVAGRTRYLLCAAVRIHVSRKELVQDLIDLLGGRLILKKKGYYNRVTWEVRTVKGTTKIVELLDQVVWPMPTIINRQHDIARRWLAHKLLPGRPTDDELANDVQFFREQLYDEMRELTEYKRSLEFKRKEEIEDGEDVEGAVGGT